MTGLFIFFLIYITLILSLVSGLWFLINYYDSIIFSKTSE